MSFSCSHNPWYLIYTKEVFSFESCLVSCLCEFMWCIKRLPPSKWPIILFYFFIKSWHIYSEFFVLFWYLVHKKYYKVFGRRCYIRRDDVDFEKIDSTNDEGIFLGYSYKRKSYRFYNLRLNKITKSENIRVDYTRSKIVKLQKKNNLKKWDGKKKKKKIKKEKEK